MSRHTGNTRRQSRSSQRRAAARRTQRQSNPPARKRKRATPHVRLAPTPEVMCLGVPGQPCRHTTDHPSGRCLPCNQKLGLKR